MPTPYDNAGHSDRATYRTNTGLRVTYQLTGYGASKTRPWMVVRDGTVSASAGCTAVEAMRLAGEPDAHKWTYTP